MKTKTRPPLNPHAAVYAQRIRRAMDDARANLTRPDHAALVFDVCDDVMDAAVHIHASDAGLTGTILLPIGEYAPDQRGSAGSGDPAYTV